MCSTTPLHSAQPSEAAARLCNPPGARLCRRPQELHFVDAPHQLPLAEGQQVAMRAWWRHPSLGAGPGGHPGEGGAEGEVHAPARASAASAAAAVPPCTRAPRSWGPCRRRWPGRRPARRLLPTRAAASAVAAGLLPAAEPPGRPPRRTTPQGRCQPHGMPRWRPTGRRPCRRCRRHGSSAATTASWGSPTAPRPPSFWRRTRTSSSSSSSRGCAPAAAPGPAAAVHRRQALRQPCGLLPQGAAAAGCLPCQLAACSCI
jgi:hypothetical protein